MNISEDSIIYPRLNMVYGAVINTTFICSSIMFPLMIYAIVRKSSKEMGALRKYFCIQVAWSYVFDLTLTTFLPIPLFPFMMGYAASPIARILGPLSGSFQLDLVIFAAIGMCHAMIIAALYRISKFAQNKMILNFIYEYKTFRLPIYILTLLFFEIGIILPMVLARVPNEQVHAVVIQKAPFMEKFFNCCILFGYETQDPNFWVNVFIIEVIVAAVCGCAGMALVNVIVLRLIKNRAKILTKKTLKLHIMLYKALTTQMLVGALLLVIPTGVASISIHLEIRYINPVVIVCLMFASSHALVEYIGVIYFIRHYRRFFIRLIRRVLSYVLKYILRNRGTNPVITISYADEPKTMTRNFKVAPIRRFSNNININLNI